jgi:hypothetical protein
MLGVTRKSKLIIMSLSLLALTLLACRNSERMVQKKPDLKGADRILTSSLVPVVERAAKFDHNQSEHKKQTCRQCHQRDEKSPTEPIPKYPYHDACVKCHTQENFLRTSGVGQLCTICHGQGELLSAQETVMLAAFPKKLDHFGLKRFSHQTHLDSRKMPPGTQLPRCDSCHLVERRLDREMSEVSFPHHPECYRCHVHSAGQKLSDCGDCHTEAGASVKFDRGAGTSYELYNFRHASHLKQTSIHFDCRACHQMLESPSGGIQSDIVRISTARGQRHQSACWKCHLQSREPVCTKCHVGGPPA